MARIVQYPILQLNSFWIKMSKFPPLWDIHWTWESRVRTDLVLWVQILDRQTKTWTWRSRLQILDRPYFFLIFDKVCTDVGQRLDKVWTSRPLCPTTHRRGATRNLSCYLGYRQLCTKHCGRQHGHVLAECSELQATVDPIWYEGMLLCGKG